MSLFLCFIFKYNVLFLYFVIRAISEIYSRLTQLIFALTSHVYDLILELTPTTRSKDYHQNDWHVFKFFVRRSSRRF